MANGVVAVTDATFAAQVTNQPGLVLVDFWADWCGPCRRVAPIVEKLAARFGADIKFAKVDVDANPLTVRAQGIQSMPTFVVFRDGVRTLEFSGALDERTFTTLIQRVVQFNGDKARIEAAYAADRGIGGVA